MVRGMRKILIIIISLMAIFSCKKQVLIKDAVIHGKVINLCTNRGLRNVEVVFREVHKKSFNKYEKEEFTTYTDNEGKFSFNKTIYKSDNYKYYIIVSSYSNKNTEFDGPGINELDKGNITRDIDIRVTATFKRLNIRLSNMLQFTAADSLHYNFEQRTVKKLLSNPVADYGTFFNSSNNITQDTLIDFVDNYFMGTWYLTIYKKKAGVITNYTDSIYLDMGDSKTYNIEW